MKLCALYALCADSTPPLFLDYRRVKFSRQKQPKQSTFKSFFRAEMLRQIRNYFAFECPCPLEFHSRDMGTPKDKNKATPLVFKTRNDRPHA
jgi:hypothetical protein